LSSGFIWSAVALKAPLVALVFAVWWAIRNEPDDPAASDEDGGVPRTDDHHRPLRPSPRPNRRGPHGDPAPPAPPRVRTVRARARTLGH
jgi:hypothetical protein